jgi:hypothetical protein
MAYVGITNQASTAGTSAADLFFALKEAMKLAGWTVLGSGTGSAGTGSGSYNNNATGNFVAAIDLVTSVALFNNPGAWIRLREPVGTREYVFHRGTVAYSYNGSVHYSRATGYTQGSPGAGVIPHTGASGDGILCSVATPILEGTSYTAAQATYVVYGLSCDYTQAVASTTPVNGVYGFWAWQYAASTGNISGYISTEGVAVGSTNSADADPSYRTVGYVVPGTGKIWASDSTTAISSFWEAYGVAGKATYRRGHISLAIAYNSASYPMVMAPNITGLDPYTSMAAFHPSQIIAAGALPKGYSTGLMWGSTTQNPMDVFNISSAEPRIYLGALQNLSVPWVPNVIPLV